MEKIGILYLQFMLQLLLTSFSVSNVGLHETINWTKKIVCSVHEINDYTNHEYYDTSLETWHRDSSHETTDFEMNLTQVITIFNKAPGMKLKSRFPLSFQLNLGGAMSIEETVYLLYLNMENKLLSAHNQLPVHPGIKWKKNVMDKIFKIFLAGCPSSFVPKGYVHMIKELFLHYQTQLYFSNEDVGKKQGQFDELSEKWDLIISHVLKDCLWSSSKLELTGKHKRINELWTISLETNGHLEKIEIQPPEEDADTDPVFTQKDEIIDEAWWIFSFVHGYCFHNFQNSSIKRERNKNPSGHKQKPFEVPTAEEFFRLFEKDFLIDLKTRWMDAGKYGRAFGTIFGQLRHNEIKRNLRYCVTAAYVKNSIEDYQLLRPFQFRYENSRTGTSIH